MLKPFNFIITKIILGILLITLLACSDDDDSSSSGGEGLVKVERPDTPINLLLTPGDGQVGLTWEMPLETLVTSYEYRISYDSSQGGGRQWSNWTSIAFTETIPSDDNADFLTESYIIAGLTNGQEYNFEVRAINGPEKGEAIQGMGTPSVFTAPRSFTATARGLQVVLGWDAPSFNGGSAITHYNYRIRRVDSNPWTSDWTTISGGASARAKTLASLDNNVDYIFEVRAISGEREGSAASITFRHDLIPFQSIWRTTSANESITLPLRSGYNYNFIVDWGDGSSSTITAHDDTDKTHTYNMARDYTVTISGLVEAWYFNNEGSKDKLIEVTDLGSVGWKNLKGAFYGCTNLTTVAGGDVSQVTNMEEMFRNAISVTPDVSGWDTSSVTNMAQMFRGTSLANPDVGHWDTSRVTTMEGLFAIAISANPDVSGWDTSSVTNMSSMFFLNSLATPDVSGWDTSSVTNMAQMFRGATLAGPDMGQWDFGSVTDMTNMFLRITLSTDSYNTLLNRIVATSSKENVTFGGGLSKYDDGASAARATLVDDRHWTIFDGGPDNDGDFVTVWKTTSNNESITLPLRSGFNYDFTVDWRDGSAIGEVTAHDDTDRTHTYTNSGTYTVTIKGLVEAWYFNDSGSSKDKLIEVTNLGDVGWKNLGDAFEGCRNLITVAGGNVSAVTNMRGMFYDADKAIPDTSGWDTSSVTNMRDMFNSAAAANPDTSGWDTSNVTTMMQMFYGAVKANPDMSQWDFGNVTNMGFMFSDSLPTASYNTLLNRINATSSKSNVSLNVALIGGNAWYSGSAILARKTLLGRG